MTLEHRASHRRRPEQIASAGVDAALAGHTAAASDALEIGEPAAPSRQTSSRAVRIVSRSSARTDRTSKPSKPELHLHTQPATSVPETDDAWLVQSWGNGALDLGASRVVLILVGAGIAACTSEASRARASGSRSQGCQRQRQRGHCSWQAQCT